MERGALYLRWVRRMRADLCHRRPAPAAAPAVRRSAAESPSTAALLAELVGVDRALVPHHVLRLQAEAGWQRGGRDVDGEAAIDRPLGIGARAVRRRLRAEEVEEPCLLGHLEDRFHDLPLQVPDG